MRRSLSYTKGCVWMTAKLSGNRKRLLKIVLIVGFFILSAIGYGLYWAFYDMNRLPTGVYLTESTSPDGKYTVKAYVSSPSLSADAVRGELMFNESKRKPKNIYWNYRESTAEIVWQDERTVVINGLSLQVPNEKFDWRHD